MWGDHVVRVRVLRLLRLLEPQQLVQPRAVVLGRLPRVERGAAPPLHRLDDVRRQLELLQRLDLLNCWIIIVEDPQSLIDDAPAREFLIGQLEIDGKHLQSETLGDFSKTPS